MALAHLLFFALYVGLGVMFVRAALMRREAVALWRAQAGGGFDKAQSRFVTELELDGADLPAQARALLRASRKAVFAGSMALAGLLALQLWMMVS